jgi:hypothetical protein
MSVQMFGHMLAVLSVQVLLSCKNRGQGEDSRLRDRDGFVG